ncbi:MAG: RidA family protein [Gemmatimonadota bacterium]
MTYRIVNPEALGQPRGWNHGMLSESGGRVLFVAGQTAADSSGRIEEDFVVQFRVALERVVAVVREAGGGPAHIGRMTIYVSNMDTYLESLTPLGEAYREVMGSHYPAMALVEISRLVEPDTMVEIEATAVLPDA